MSTTETATRKRPAEAADTSSPKRQKTEDVGHWLDKFQVRDVLRAKQHRNHGLIELYHNMSVGEAMTVLAKNNILSAPVVMAPSLDDDGGVTGDQYLGFVDVSSLMQHIFREVVAEADKEKSMVKKWDKLDKLGEDLTERLLITVVGSDASLLYRGLVGTSLRMFISEAFLNATDDAGEKGVHRVGIFNKFGAMSNILTQSDIIRFALQHADSIPGIDSTLEELGLVGEAADVDTVHKKELAADALEKMLDLGHTSLGVVDDNGHLTATISAADLRGLDADEMHLLLTPVIEFVRTERKNLRQKHMKPDSDVVVFTRNDTLRSVLKAVSRDRLHRVYIVDSLEDLTPRGILTLSDLLRVFVR